MQKGSCMQSHSVGVGDGDHVTRANAAGDQRVGGLKHERFQCLVAQAAALLCAEQGRCFVFPGEDIQERSRMGRHM